jgi:5-methyltetrahydrofolate--homocysteine methyltransferase
MSDFKKLADSVFKGSINDVKAITQELINNGAKPLDIINQGLLGGMDLVTPKFKSGEMFVPEVLRCAKALGAGMEVLKPFLSETDCTTDPGTFIIGTVAGDVHDIGKNLVVLILGSCSVKVIDLGVDVSPEKFIAAIKEHRPQIVGLSALLTSTMMAMKKTIDAISSAGLRDKVKILVGGAPISQKFADEIGADAFCPDAIAAKEIAAAIMANR